MSSADKRQTIDIVGGTYWEYCIDPDWNNIYGSGLRAALAVKVIAPDCNVQLHTIADRYIKQHVESHYDNIIKEIIDAPSGTSPISFIYQNALKSPLYYNVSPNYPKLQVASDNCVVFGMMEGSAQVDADYVVYDPQSPNNPVPFSKTNSHANHLCIIMNEGEAKAWTQEVSASQIMRTIFESEQCDCLVIKKGASGAILYDSPDSLGISIPAYKTDNVWTIGSGDIFTAAFGFYWMLKRNTPEESARLSSKAVACYSNSKSLDCLFGPQIEATSFEEHIPKSTGKVYLAGPFFSMAQRAFVNECRDALMQAGLSVFSPFHDVGIGAADEVVPKDIDAIVDCKTIFAILDGMDPGTLFEIGYGVALGKKVVILAENESDNHLIMMYGTKCVIEKDFVTAIYKTCWLTNE